MTDKDQIIAFFKETHLCGPGAEGEWRSGAEVHAAFATWAGFAMDRNSLLTFYECLREIGFVQRNAERVYFFVPKRLEAAA